jgi:hypothetical protein
MKQQFVVVTHTVDQTEIPTLRDSWVKNTPLKMHPKNCYPLYKVVQIWPGQTVTCLHTASPGHIWTTLYFRKNTTRLSVSLLRICEVFLFALKLFICWLQEMGVVKVTAVFEKAVHNSLTGNTSDIDSVFRQAEGILCGSASKSNLTR